MFGKILLCMCATDQRDISLDKAQTTGPSDFSSLLLGNMERRVQSRPFSTSLALTFTAAFPTSGLSPAIRRINVTKRLFSDLIIVVGLLLQVLSLSFLSVSYLLSGLALPTFLNSYGDNNGPK